MLAFLGAVVLLVLREPSSILDWVVFVIALSATAGGFVVTLGMVGQWLGLARPHPLTSLKRRSLARKQLPYIERMLEEMNRLLVYDGASGRTLNVPHACQILMDSHLSTSSKDASYEESAKVVRQMVGDIADRHESVRLLFNSISSLFTTSGTHGSQPSFQGQVYLSLTKAVLEYAKIGELFDRFLSRIGEVRVTQEEKRKISSLVTAFNDFMKSYKLFADNFPEQIAQYGFEPSYVRWPRFVEA